MGWVQIATINYYPTEGNDYYQLRAVAKLTEPFKTNTGRYCGTLTETYSVCKIGKWETASFEEFLEQAKAHLKELFHKRVCDLNK